MTRDDANRSTHEITVSVNGSDVEAVVEPRYKLADFLREIAGTTTVKTGCEHGSCGACAVEMDGRIIKSCLQYAVRADGAEITTAEGFNGDEMHPIQQAFTEHHAIQCGFCTGGFIMATKALLERNPDPDREQIQRALFGNLCRCTGYENIVDAVENIELEGGRNDDP